MSLQCAFSTLPIGRHVHPSSYTRQIQRLWGANNSENIILTKRLRQTTLFLAVSHVLFLILAVQLYVCIMKLKSLYSEQI